MLAFPSQVFVPLAATPSPRYAFSPWSSPAPSPGCFIAQQCRCLPAAVATVPPSAARRWRRGRAPDRCRAGQLRTGRRGAAPAHWALARRQQPGQEFNHGLVLSREPLRDGRVFTVRIDRKVQRWVRGTEMWRAVGGD
ncbi:hypothetical protein P7K49_011000 [Saguinus oedipus]|uniref:NHR domain-containing protein n=1 Tax=Saguinus oedipus TaxID=9490 RepID=A0ABQ9VPF2_SAGOE|nr:hypothetical protein P7K49_011000 [Saguinus oedipus]